jgi:hypothetical protein
LIKIFTRSGKVCGVGIAGIVEDDRRPAKNAGEKQCPPLDGVEEGPGVLEHLLVAAGENCFDVSRPLGRLE